PTPASAVRARRRLTAGGETGGEPDTACSWMSAASAARAAVGGGGRQGTAGAAAALAAIQEVGVKKRPAATVALLAAATDAGPLQRPIAQPFIDPLAETIMALGHVAHPAAMTTFLAARRAWRARNSHRRLRGRRWSGGGGGLGFLLLGDR